MQVLCIGAAHIDEHVQAKEALERDASVPARVTRAPGGVMLNVATALSRLGVDVVMASIIGGDADGDIVLQHCRQADMDTGFVTRLQDDRTARYLAVLGMDGYLAYGLVLDEIYEQMTPDWLAGICVGLPSGMEILVDMNLPEDSLVWLAGQAKLHGWHLSAVAVSPVKVRRLANCLPGLTRLFLSRQEAYALLSALGGTVSAPAQAAQSLFEHGVSQVLLTRGEKGMVAVNAHGLLESRSLAFDIRNVTGAGDNAVAGWFAAYAQGLNDQSRLDHAMAAAALALNSPIAIPHDLSADRLNAIITENRRSQDA